MRYTLQFADTNQHPHLSCHPSVSFAPTHRDTRTQTHTHTHSLTKGRSPPSTQLLLPLLLFRLIFLLLLFYSSWGIPGLARTNQINYLRIYSNKVVDKPSQAEAAP